MLWGEACKLILFWYTHLVCEEYVVRREGSMGHVVFSEVDKTFKDLIGQLGQGVWLSKIP